ncbi:MAG: hypothetical protein R2706_12200 [Acidimicrobiales bacterium]
MQNASAFEDLGVRDVDLKLLPEHGRGLWRGGGECRAERLASIPNSSTDLAGAARRGWWRAGSHPRTPRVVHDFADDLRIPVVDAVSHAVVSIVGGHYRSWSS